MTLKLIWRNLWRNMRRTTITAASIAFAVVFAILMQSYRIGVFNNMIKNVVGYYSGYIQIHQLGYWNEQVLDNCFEVDVAMFKNIQSTPEISEIVPRIETFILISKEDKTKGCMLVGTDATQENKLTQLKSKVVKGNYFENDSNAIILG
jgi:putative ABC transport system permease protein